MALVVYITTSYQNLSSCRTKMYVLGKLLPKALSMKQN
jgi:hypothetical protein